MYELAFAVGSDVFERYLRAVSWNNPGTDLLSVFPGTGRDLGQFAKGHCSGHLRVRHIGTTVIDDVLFCGGVAFL